MQTVLIVFHVLLAAALIGLVLLQRGAGATAGAAFGAGASGTVFGARGAASFLTRATAVLAVGFFLISLTMAVLAARTAPQAPTTSLGIEEAPVEQVTDEVFIDDGADDAALEFPEIPAAEEAAEAGEAVGTAEESEESVPDEPVEEE